VRKVDPKPSGFGGTFSEAKMELGKDTEETVGVIVLWNNQILLVRGVGSHKWSFPKGHRRENETSLEGAIREAKEEAGINLTDIKPTLTLLLRYGTYFLYTFQHLPELDAPTTPEEIVEVAWKNYQSMKEEKKNADLRFYLKMTKPKNLKRSSTPTQVWRDGNLSSHPSAN